MSVMEIIDSPSLYKDQRFFLNDESWDKLAGVTNDLSVMVQHAIGMSDIEFQVLEGKRTTAEHDFLYSKGATQDAHHSAHFYGYAVDLIVYLDGRIILEKEPYDDVAQCMQFAAEYMDIPIRWGGAWHVPDLRGNKEFYEDLTNDFMVMQLEFEKTPIIDFHHFEIPVE
jgi:peptidoglycan L-alanyl-D-glutamate endopeptidase CwlK